MGERSQPLSTPQRVRGPGSCPQQSPRRQGPSLWTVPFQGVGRCRHGSEEPPPPFSHTLTHACTHFEARRSLGSCRASETLEKVLGVGAGVRVICLGLEPSAQPAPTAHRGTGWSRVSMAALRRQGLMRGSRLYPTRENEAVLPTGSLVHRMGAGRLRLRYSPRDQGPPWDLADPGKRRAVSLYHRGWCPRLGLGPPGASGQHPQPISHPRPTHRLPFRPSHSALPWQALERAGSEPRCPCPLSQPPGTVPGSADSNPDSRRRAIGWHTCGRAARTHRAAIVTSLSRLALGSLNAWYTLQVSSMP